MEVTSDKITKVIVGTDNKNMLIDKIEKRLRSRFMTNTDPLRVSTGEHRFWLPPTGHPGWTNHWEIAEAAPIVFYALEDHCADTYSTFLETLASKPLLQQALALLWGSRKAVSVSDDGPSGYQILLCLEKGDSSGEMEAAVSELGFAALTSDAGQFRIDGPSEYQILYPQPKSTEFPYRIRIRSIPTISKAVEMFAAATTALTSSSPPKQVQYSLRGVPSEAKEIASTCRQVGGRWATTFTGSYDPELDFRNLDSLPCGYLPIIQATRNFNEGLAFQLGLRVTSDETVLEAYSIFGEDFIAEMVPASS